jgi:hypothetical protein
MSFRQEIRSSRAELKFPSFRMSDGLRFTDSYTRRWFCTIARSARSAAILDLLALLLFHKCDGFFAEDVNLVRTYLYDFGRTDFRALAATIALVRVDGDIPVARPIPKTIIGYHFIRLSFPPHRCLPAGRLSLSPAFAEAASRRQAPGGRGIRS